MEFAQFTIRLLATGCMLLNATFAQTQEPAVINSGAVKRSSPSSALTSQASFIAEVVPFPPFHAAGNDVPTTLRLKNQNGKPATLEDLQVSDAANVDVLVVDESLSDFHYQHLTATDKEGEYRFVLRSRYGGRYYVWTGVSPRPSGENYFIKATVQVTGASKTIEKIAKTSATVDEFRFNLSIAHGDTLIEGRPAHLSVRIISQTGVPVELSPLMQKGSLSAFASDFTSAALMFPTEPITLDSSHPELPHLTFTFTPPSPGFWKLFYNVKLGGITHVALFGLNVIRAEKASGALEPAAEK